jgi:hypothetical protein
LQQRVLRAEGQLSQDFLPPALSAFDLRRLLSSQDLHYLEVSRTHSQQLQRHQHRLSLQLHPPSAYVALQQRFF